MADRDIEFEWSVAKAKNNLKKHGVSFEEAETVFEDPHAYTQEDELHSDHESREVIIGYSDRKRLLMVSFIQLAEWLVRIISSRRATPRERRVYEEED